MYLLGTVTAALVGLILAAESILRLDERLERRRAAANKESTVKDGTLD